MYTHFIFIKKIWATTKQRGVLFISFVLNLKKIDETNWNVSVYVK